MSEPRVPVLITAVGELSPIELKKLRADMDVAGTQAPSHVSASKFEISMLLAQGVVAAAKLGNPAMLQRRLGLLGDAGRVEAHAVIDALRVLMAEYGRGNHDGLQWCVMCLMSAIDVRLAEVQVQIAALEAAFNPAPETHI